MLSENIFCALGHSEFSNGFLNLTPLSQSIKLSYFFSFDSGQITRRFNQHRQQEELE